MAIILKRPAQVQRGNLQTTHTYRFRGNWTAQTQYTRGDIIIDPYGVLRWAGTTHKSGNTFSPGTQYSANAPWWKALSVNGVYRGPYVVSQGSYNTLHHPGDIVLDVATNQFVRALYADSASTSWQPTRYSDMGLAPPFDFTHPAVILQPADMPGASPHTRGHGLWMKSSRLQYPRVKPLCVFNSSASFTSITNGTTTADPDLVDPNGNPMFSYTTGLTGTVPLKQLGTTVNISNSILRVLLKISSFGTSPNPMGTIGTALSTGAPITNLPLMSGLIGVAPLWVSGSSYTTGQQVQDPTSLGYYQALGNLSNNTTKPSLDAVNWLPIYQGLALGAGPNCPITITDPTGAHTQTFTVSDYASANAGAGVSQLPVASLTPTFAFPAGSTIATVSRSGHIATSVQVSSDNFATHASSADLYSTGKIADTAWTWSGAGPGMWGSATGFANPADLTAINAIRFVLRGAVTIFFSVARVDVIPNNGAAGSKGDGHAKCSLWFDDCYAGHWTYCLSAMIPYGFPGNLASAASIDGSASTLTLAQMHYMATLHGWQCANHYHQPNDGGDDQLKEGMGKESYIMAARHSLKGAACWGTDVHAWHDDDHPSSANLIIHRKYFLAHRGYIQGDGLYETLPPVSHDYTHGYGVGSSDQSGGQIATTTGTIAAGSVSSLPITTGAGNGIKQNLANTEQIIVNAPSCGTVATKMNAGTYTSIPLGAGGLAVTLQDGQTVASGGFTFVVSGTQAANGSASSITVQSTTIGTSISAGTIITPQYTFVVNGNQAANTATGSISVVAQTTYQSITGTAVFNPGSVMKSMVDSAITYAGWTQFVWENVSTVRAEFLNILAYLDARRVGADAFGGGGIDVVTAAEALAPWTVPVG